MWVKLDDQFPDHPKVERISDGAFRLHVSALCHAARYLTDGVISDERPAKLISRFRPKYVSELLDAGLWVRQGRGYVIHDFTHWNKTREHWEKKRADDAERLRLWREKRSAEGREGDE